MLDTQVVLDWLVFGDAAACAVGAALQCKEMRWIATAPMHQELMHVLGRGVGASRQPDHAAVSKRYLASSHRFEPAAAAVPALRCRDPDDQMFIDLAVAAGARWLFTRDRALLALRRAALRHGIGVLRPTDWRRGAVIADEKP